MCLCFWLLAQVCIVHAIGMCLWVSFRNACTSGMCVGLHSGFGGVLVHGCFRDLAVTVLCLTLPC